MRVKEPIILGIVFFALGITALKTEASEVVIGSNTELSPISIEKYDPIVVLELFTSQGCSSCPPADALLEKVKGEHVDLVYALSYHVDYWNYIGWKDPFSRSAFTRKQQAYNLKFKNRSIYTPQVVVNGKEHFVGSDSRKMKSAIETYGNSKAANGVTILKAVADNRTVSFHYKIDGPTAEKGLRAILVLNRRTTKVHRGENQNRTLVNSNIVVAEKKFSMGEGTGLLTLPDLVRPEEAISLLLLVENEANDITGAGKRRVLR